jgi:glycosyltransferase involved in cell wall biosynthesis
MRKRTLQNLDRVHRQIAADIDAGAYDVIFANSSINTFIPLLLGYTQTPSVYYLHEPFGRGLYAHAQYDRPYNSRRETLRNALDQIDPILHWQQHTLEALQRRSLSGTTHLLGNSQFTCELMAQMHAVSAEFVPYGVDSEMFRPVPTVEKRNVVISVGEMAPRKGFDFLVRALGQVDEGIRPKLHLVSNRIDAREQAYVEQLAIENNVEIVLDSHFNADQLRDAYNQALLCVYSPVAEPLGLVPLEAMACGIPVVGVREGGVAETVIDGHTGYLTARDPAVFAERISVLLQQAATRAELGANARRYVTEQWTWVNSTRQIETHLAAACRPTPQTLSATPHATR